VRARLNAIDRRANRALWVLCGVGALVLFFVLAETAYQVINGASASISRYGIAFLGHTSWLPTKDAFGAGAFIYGTAVTSVTALVFATVIGVSIGLFLGMLAPRPVAVVVGPMVEMLAAIPSVVLGFLGILVIGPFLRETVEPVLHSVLGFIPLFGPVPETGDSMFTASAVLTIMVVPIIAALSRDLFRTVPRELVEGAEALGATRWEVVRGVVLPTTTSGVIAACVLGFGRAFGEAIAVSQVIGNAAVIHSSLFNTGDSLASAIATEFIGSANGLQVSSLFYFALILLVFGLLTNLISRRIASGFQARVG
jgi:phosphate transport system permease protein